MSNPILAKAVPIGSVILSALVMLICVGGILITWVMNYALGSLVVDLSAGAEKTAQVLQRGVTRMETGVTNLQTEVQSISQATTQISQNIADEGLIRQLLPAEKEARLDSGLERLTTTFTTVNDALSSARDMYRAINRIPGVNLPQPSEDTTSRLSQTVTDVRSDVQELKSGVQRVRGGAANTVNQVAEVADRVAERLGNLLSELQTFNSQLTGVQEASQQLRRTIPAILTIIAVILSLVQLWVIYTQYVILRLYWGKWNTPALATAAGPALAAATTPEPTPLPSPIRPSSTAPPPAAPSSTAPVEPAPSTASPPSASSSTAPVEPASLPGIVRPLSTEPPSPPASGLTGPKLPEASTDKDAGNKPDVPTTSA